MNVLRGNTNQWKTCCSLLLILYLTLGGCEAAIKDVRIHIEPSLVQRSHQATITCLYDRDIPLFSVKFYRGLREFYRYSPHESPRNRQFPFPGINVDMSQSNESQVVIKNVGFGLAGNFSCEVTADAPLFSTGTAYSQLQVVELPNNKPIVLTDSTYYEPGDVLQANCTSPPTRPPVELTLTLNNQVLYDAESVQFPTTPGYLTRIETNVRLHLQSSHFRSPNQNGQSVLVLRCTARIDNFYHEFAEVFLRTSARDPVPERVTSNQGSRLGNLMELLVISSAIFILLQRFWRYHQFCTLN